MEGPQSTSEEKGEAPQKGPAPPAQGRRVRTVFVHISVKRSKHGQLKEASLSCSGNLEKQMRQQKETVPDNCMVSDEQSLRLESLRDYAAHRHALDPQRLWK